MKPFNLERALAGDPLCTRNGREVTQFHKFNVQDNYMAVYCVIDGGVKSFTIDGFFYLDKEESGNDLFMDSVKKEGWINIYKTGVGNIRSGELVYETRELAISKASLNILDTVRLEWEE